MNKVFLFVLSGLIGFSFARLSSEPPLLQKNPLLQKKESETSPRKFEEKKEEKSETLPESLVETGLFENLPPKLTEAEIEDIKKNKTFSSIFIREMGVHIANTPRNRKLKEITAILPVAKVVIQNGNVKTVNLNNLIPVDLFDFVY